VLIVGRRHPNSALAQIIAALYDTTFAGFLPLPARGPDQALAAHRNGTLALRKAGRTRAGPVTVFPTPKE
jgi:hypothetical protein